MNRKILIEVAKELEKQVSLAKQRGFKNADCVLTPEVVDLLPKIYAREIKSPVKLQFTAGPHWNFCETDLGECSELESAWANFCIEIQGQRELVESIKYRVKK